MSLHVKMVNCFYSVSELNFMPDNIIQSCTCKSFWGFQSESNITQVSAAVRLIPRPPARVHSRKTKRSESGLLKRSMAACRKFPRTRPSIRSYRYLFKEKNKTNKLYTLHYLPLTDNYHIYSGYSVTLTHWIHNYTKTLIPLVDEVVLENV